MTADSDSDGNATTGKYRIGSVATLTGLSTHTIRAWERRYGLIRPSRSPSGLRLYGDADVSRLQLLRALTECGEAIGEIAGLPDAALRERLARHAHPAERSRPEREPSDEASPARAVVLGATLAEQLAVAAAGGSSLEIVGVAATAQELEPRLAQTGPDVWIAELEALGPDPLATVARLAERAPEVARLVLYGFAPRARLAHLAAGGAHLLKRPADAAAVRRAVADARAIHGALRSGAPRPPLDLRGSETGAPPPRLFDDRQLAILQEVRSSVQCECPNQLSGIVGSLVAFESYSRQCEAENPEDAALHATLAEGTGRARAIMERLLAHLCQQDEISV